ncbi:hypothetical protein C9J85_05575 [Haloferax sp. wsp5]|nr:hypothetical protein C9J85_05575 [Haloferax sp. wsp5]
MRVSSVTGRQSESGDADGTVDLISPLQTVTVDVAAEHDVLTAETTVTLRSGRVAAEDPFDSSCYSRKRRRSLYDQ